MAALQYLNIIMNWGWMMYLHKDDNCKTELYWTGQKYITIRENFLSNSVENNAISSQLIIINGGTAKQKFFRL